MGKLLTPRAKVPSSNFAGSMGFSFFSRSLNILYLHYIEY